MSPRQCRLVFFVFLFLFALLPGVGHADVGHTGMAQPVEPAAASRKSLRLTVDAPVAPLALGDEATLTIVVINESTEPVDNQDLSGEIGLIRTLVRRITRYLNDSDREFTVKDLAMMVNLAYQGTRTVAHLIARNNGGASFADILEEALGDMDRLHDRDEA